MAIALITDFGETDYFAGAVKGSILSINPEANIVDITHSVPRHDVSAAAFCLAACYRDFPLETVFLCVVDPGVGSKRRGIAVFADGRYFVAPDNGLLTHVLNDYPDAIVVELESSAYLADKISKTFHGRDVFGPVAAHISKGIAIGLLGPPLGNPVVLELVPATDIGLERIAGSVIHIDQFGNIVTNIPASKTELIYSIEIAGRKIAFNASSYAEAPVNTLFFIAGSAGFIEISKNEESAADYLHSLRGDKLEAHLKKGSHE